MTAKPKPRPVGRPSKLTPELTADICKTLRACGTIEDACSRAGIDPATYHRWAALGAAQRRGRFREFCDSLDAAVRDRRLRREAQLEKAGEKDWRALAWIMERTEQKRYAPRVLVHVQQELSDGLERLKVAFADQPEALERALHALAGGDGGGRALADGAGPGGEDDTDSQAVLAGPAES